MADNSWDLVKSSISLFLGKKERVSFFDLLSNIYQPFGEAHSHYPRFRSKMSQKTRVSPTLQPIKSLPGDFRFTGLPTSQTLEKSNDVNQRKGTMIPIASIPEDSDSAGEVVDHGEDDGIDTNQDNDESPYSGFNVSVETSPSLGSEDLDLAPPLGSFVPVRIESKWSDTNPYAAKKVLDGYSFSSSSDVGLRHCLFFFSFSVKSIIYSSICFRCYKGILLCWKILTCVFCCVSYSFL